MTEAAEIRNDLESREFIEKSLGSGHIPTYQKKCAVLEYMIMLKMKGYPFFEAPKKIREIFGQGWAEVVQDVLDQARTKRKEESDARS